MHKLRHYLYFLEKRELNELYVSVAIKSFAVSMISIFVPIFLLNLNYSLTTVLIFYAVVSIAHALFIIPAAKISSKMGFKHSIVYSIPVLILFYAGLYTLELFNWPLYALAIVFGISNALYWIGYHIDFSIFSDEKKRGTQIGKAKIVTLIFQILGPLTGGLILTFAGFQTLFILVSLLLAASTIPLFFSGDVYKSVPISIKEIFGGQKVRNAITFMGHGIESGVAMVIWPIFIFTTILNSFTTLGLVSSLSLLFSVLFVFIVGRFSDINRRLVLKVGAILNSIIWSVRFFVQTTFQVFIVDSLYGISQALITIPFDAMSYDKANKTDVVKFIMFREILVQAGRVLLFAVLAVFAIPAIGIFLGAGASLLYLLF